MEKVLDQIRQGNTRAETIIRGQHEQLTGSIDREQKTKRELVSSYFAAPVMPIVHCLPVIADSITSNRVSYR